MQAITIAQAQKLTSSNPFALVTSIDAEGHHNVIAEVVGIYGDAAMPGLYAMNGYGKLGTVSAE